MQISSLLRRFLCVMFLGLLAACDSTTAAEYLNRAEQSYQAREYRTAVIELKNALQQQPDLAEARFLLGASHARLGDYTSALKELERALDLGIDDEALRVELLTAKNRLGRFQEVIGELEGVGELSPALAAVLGDAYLAGQDIDAARQMYQQATGIAPGNLGLGTIAWMQGDQERARHYLTRATELAPESYETWLRLAEFEFSEARAEASEAAFRRAEQIPGGEISAQIGLARVELARGNAAAAAPYVEEVLARAPQLFVAHYLDALIKFQQQQVDAAEAALREVQRVVPDHPPSLYLMGAVKYQQGQLSQARDNLQRFLAVDPRNESAVKLLASVYLRDGDVDRAIELLARVAESSDDPQLLAMLGSAQLRAGDTSAATANLEAAVERAPDAAAFRNQLALSLLSAGQTERAAGELEAAIAVDDNQFQSEYLLAMVHLQAGDYAAAEAAVDSLIGKHPDNPLGYNLKGGVLLGRDDAAAATVQFQKALELDPAYFPAARSLARLDLQNDDPAAAQARFESVLAADPASAAAHFALAELALQARDSSAAEAELLAVLELNPQSVRARVALLRLYLAANRVADAAAQFEAAQVAGEPGAELLLLGAELDLRSGAAAAARDKADRLQTLLAAGGGSQGLQLGLAALQARVGQLTLARTNLERILDADAENLAALREMTRIDLLERRLEDAAARLAALKRLGATGSAVQLLDADLLRLEGKTEQALAAYRQLAEQGVRDGLVRHAVLAMSEGGAESARESLSAWLEDHPDDGGVRILLADAMLRSGAAEAAIGEYERLVDLDNPVVLNNLAWLYMERGDSRAQAMAERATELAPRNAEVADTLGWILLQRNQPTQAIAQLRRSVQLNPNNAAVHYHLASAYLAAGNEPAARRALQQALELGNFPERPQAERMLRELSGD